ncbi:MAG: hypothetical protein RL571_3386 [Pseudomonadota bacterium]|jgi:hypothetical protein
MLIRKLTPNDAAALKAIRLEAVQDSPTSFWPNAEETQARELASFCQQLSDPYQTVYGFFKNRFNCNCGFKTVGLSQVET